LRGGAGRIELVAPAETVVVAPPALPLPPVVAPEPAVVAERPARRVIKMIKGGVESTVVLSLPNAASAEAYGTTDSTDPFGEE
jgi:hypothetical protein